MSSSTPAAALAVRSAAASLAAAGALLLALAPAADAGHAGHGGTGGVEEKIQAPTTLAVSLEGAGQSGVSITVPNHTPVAALAALGGANATTARGPVSYEVYTDPSCTQEIANAGHSGGRQADPSRSVRLSPGTYYWQASYAGDATNQPALSACGSAVEVVEGYPPVPPCSTVSGEMRVDTEEGHLGVRDGLSTNLDAHQRLYAWWSGKHHLRLTRLLEAICVAKRTLSVFHGWGEARLDGKPGYTVSVKIRVGKNGTEAIHLHVRNPRHELVLSLSGFPAPGSEIIG